nr:DUF4417 domain-containing protein [Thiorhodovibrio winogradskyi]
MNVTGRASEQSAQSCSHHRHTHHPALNSGQAHPQETRHAREPHRRPQQRRKESVTRSSANWITKPGSFDPLNTARRFPASSPFGIPDLEPQSFDVPEDIRLRPYRSRIDRLDHARDICHFYLDDYRFETTWNSPGVGWRHVSAYWATCTPDFSLYPAWPRAMQLWQTYRARWVARFWQERGCRVIPTVNWSDAQSWAFCFDGIPPSQTLTISVADLRRPHVERRFRAGLVAMLERLTPRLLLVYGRLRFDPGCPVREIAPDWERLRALPTPAATAPGPWLSPKKGKGRPVPSPLPAPAQTASSARAARKSTH